jgi:hypothetical protein
MTLRSGRSQLHPAGVHPDAVLLAVPHLADDQHAVVRGPDLEVVQLVLELLDLHLMGAGLRLEELELRGDALFELRPLLLEVALADGLIVEIDGVLDDLVAGINGLPAA